MAALVVWAAACSSSTDAGNPSPPVQADTALYEDVTATHLPSSPGRFTMDAALGDFDGDGDVDLLLAVEFGQNRLLINDGTGRFTDATAGRLPSAAHDSEDIGIADFDGDGDLDAVVVSEDDQTNEFYVNDGAGTFTAAVLPVAGTSNGVVVGDVDGDQDPDIVIGNAGAEAVLINDGSGNWSDESAARIPAAATGVTQDVELGDVDLDGDLDLLIGNENGNRLLLNDGTGVFTDETATWIPLRTTPEETREVDLGDIDGDGDLDALFANTRSSNDSADPGNRLLLNQGDRFTDVTGVQMPPGAERSFDGEFWDVDADGDLDIVTGSLTVAGGQATRSPYLVLINDGAGIFASWTDPIFPTSAVGFGFDTEMADIDGDGDGDFVLASRSTQDLLLLRR